MRKKFIEVLNDFIINTNKSIFDLDIKYLENHGYPNIKEIKSVEMSKILEDSFYVFNECLKISPKANQRFIVSYKLKQQRGNLVEFKITDNKTNKEYTDLFEWHPLLTKKGYFISHQIITWLNNVLVELNIGA